MHAVVKYPDSTKTSLEHRLNARARATLAPADQRGCASPRQLQLRRRRLARRHRTKLCRLRYGGSAHQWGFAIYRASHDDYAESVFPTGLPVGTCEDALDTACGLYLGDPTAWT